MPEERQDEDEELTAIKIVLAALSPLKPEARNNVIDYVFRRLKIAAPLVGTPAQRMVPDLIAPEPAVSRSAALSPNTSGPSTPGLPSDLRSLRERKQPKSANQMVTLLAYYLANLAPIDQRRDYIVPDDIKRYFPQANFELPTGAPAQTLVNAKNAGYLDILGNGQYRLNPVGHNLVTHKLPAGEGSAPTRGRRRAKKAVKKAAKKPKART